MVLKPRFGRVKNSLKMGVVGLPNVGKSSLFNLLTSQAVAAENYPFCTIDPNTARCAVPDERYEWLCNVWKPPSTQPAWLNVTDIAGLIRGASEGAGLGNEFLSHIQAVDGLLHMVRAFDDDEVVHVDDSVDPVRDLETIVQELCKKDQSYVKHCQDEKKKEIKKNPTFKLPPLYYEVMEKVDTMLAANQMLSNAEWTAPEVDKLNELIPLCITLKPVVYIVNLSKKDCVRKANKWLPKIKEWIDSHGGGVMIPLSVEYEAELWAMRESPEAQAELVKTCGGLQSTLPRVIKASFRQLRLGAYFTAGEKEVRCWTIMDGVTAPEAAGVIHSDFQRGFIKAEVCSFADFKEYSGGVKTGMTQVKAAGKYRQEGKNYVVQSGDIIQFQFNVAKGGKAAGKK